MPETSDRTTSRPPVYGLYGETSPSQHPIFDAEVMHSESIAARSQQLGWEIRPHRHAHLMQFLHIEVGQVDLTLEQQRHTLRGPALIVVPAGVVHGFAFEPGTQGWVSSVTPGHLEALAARQPGWWNRVAQAGLWPLGEELAPLRQASEHLQRLHAQSCAGRHLALDAAWMQLIWRLGCTEARHNLLLGADRPDDPTADRPSGGSRLRSRFHLQRYRDWVELNFRRQPRLEDAAQVLGITPTQLNRICRERLGCTALALLQQRTVQEACRDLRFTLLSVQQIGWDLGFADAAYFSRFFRRHTGRSPRRWRDEVQSGQPWPPTLSASRSP